MKREIFKHAGYCHQHVIDYYKKFKPRKNMVPCKLIRLMAKVAAENLDMHTQVYLTTRGRNYVAYIPFSAYEFKYRPSCDPSLSVNCYKMGAVITGIYSHFKKSHTCGFVLTADYVGVELCSV